MTPLRDPVLEKIEPLLKFSEKFEKFPDFVQNFEFEKIPRNFKNGLI